MSDKYKDYAPNPPSVIYIDRSGPFNAKYKRYSTYPLSVTDLAYYLSPNTTAPTESPNIIPEAPHE